MIIWIASYPKSGNTWLRSIIGNFYNFDKDFSLNDLKLIPLLSIKKHFSEFENKVYTNNNELHFCLLYTSPSPRDRQKSRMPSSA